MPFPRSRLDAYLVFPYSGLEVDSLQNQFKIWCQKGYVTNEGTMGLSSNSFGLGSFDRLTVIHSNTSMLFANHQGGYRVFCPKNDKIVTVDFTNAVAKWRALQNTPSKNQVYCSGCNGIHSLVDFYGKPRFSFGKLAFHFIDIESSKLNEERIREVESNIGICSLILKRVG